MEVVSLIPFTDILKLVVAEAKKVKEFKPLFKELASTIERLVPIFEEIDLLQERLDPGNKELNFLTKLMLRAKKMVHECSQVRVYSILKKKSYTNKIKKINEDFVKFCQVDLQLIRHRDQLRSRSQTRLNIEESPPPPLQGEHGQLSLALEESLKMEELSSQEAEELQSAIQESLLLRRQHDEQIANGSSSFTRVPLAEEDEQRLLWESFNTNGKRKLVQEEDEQVAVALQESLNSFKDNGKRKKVEEEDELVSVAIQESLNSFKKNEKRKKVEEEDELVAVAIQESLNSFKDNGKRKQAQKDEQVARDLHERINKGSPSFTRAHSFDEDDMQWILLESLTKRQRKSI